MGLAFGYGLEFAGGFDQALRKEGLSLKEASRRISEKTGISRKVLYDAVLERQEADEP